jgi:hypothetical protein
MAGALWMSASKTIADAEIVIAIRYLRAEGISHAHLYLYREDGKFLRQLTTGDSGQDVDPVFASNGETIVWTREKPNEVREFWSIEPLGSGAKRLEAAPDWYAAAKSSPYFTNRGNEKSAEDSPSPTPAEPPRFKTPDDSFELILKTLPEDEEDRYDGPGHGKHYVVRHLLPDRETEFATLPGFFGAFQLLHENQNKDRQFLFEQPLRVAFFDLHLNSTDGDTVFALDFNGMRLLRLSPNWAAPIPLPGQAAFLTLTENRYVPIPGTTKTANCSYLEHWDAKFNKIRYAKEKSAAICYGSSMFRPGRTPAIITIRKNAD